MSNQKFQIEDIYELLREVTGVKQLNSQTDIYGDLRVSGDDFHELIEKYQKTFDVNIDNYLWYFHSDEEGMNFPGGLFFKTPYERVNRIPITPELLLKFANSGTWGLKYPEHEIPEKRYDLLVNTIFNITFIAIVALVLIYNYYYSE